MSFKRLLDWAVRAGVDPVVAVSEKEKAILTNEKRNKYSTL